MRKLIFEFEAVESLILELCDWEGVKEVSEHKKLFICIDFYFPKDSS